MGHPPMTYAIRVEHETVGMHIYQRATDVNHIMQAQVRHRTSREIDLDGIGKLLKLKGKCYVSTHYHYK